MKGRSRELFEGNKGAIYVIALFNALAVGVINPVISTHLTTLKVSELLVGLNSSAYFLAIILGSVFLRKKMQNRNLKVLIILGLLLSSLSIIAFSIADSVVLWFTLRILMGIGLSFTYVGTQTMLHSYSKSSSLGLISGIYSASFAAGYIIGAVIGPVLYVQLLTLPFLISAASLMLGMFGLILLVREDVLIGEATSSRVLKKIDYPIQAIFVYGFAEAIIIHLLPVFLLEQKVPTEMIGMVLGAFIVGSLIGTIPVSYLADRIGREKTMGISMLFAVVALSGIIFSASLVLFIVFALIAGIAVGPVYALSLSLIAQNLSGEERSSGNAFFNGFYSLGAAIGPLGSSLMMKLIGSRYLFVLCLLLFALLLAKSVGKIYLKPSRSST